MAKNPTRFDVDITSTYHDPIGDLSKLTTTAKDNLVDAVNEINAKQGGGSCTCQAIDIADVDALFN